MWARRFLFLALALSGLIPTVFRPFVEEASKMLVYLEFLVPFSIVLAVGFFPQSPGNLLLQRSHLLFVVIGFSITSACLGFIFEWELRDILADVARFVAPFISFYVALGTFNQSSALTENVKTYLAISVMLVLVSVLVKGYFVIFQGASLIQYGVLHIRQEFVAALILLFFLRSSSFQWRMAFFILAVAIVLSPILAVSKTSIVLAATWFIIALYASRAPAAVKGVATLFVGGLAFGFSVVMGEDVFFVFSRMGESLFSISDLSSGVVGSDMSTLGRIAEAESAFESMQDFAPMSWIIGMGSGALWNPIGSLSFEGLHDLNFRLTGGGHHIHLTWVALLFRYGLLGTLIYVYFVSWLIVRANLSATNASTSEAYNYKWALRAHIILSTLGSIFTYFIYGSVEFGIVAGLFCSIVVRTIRGEDLRLWKAHSDRIQ